MKKTIIIVLACFFLSCNNFKEKNVILTGEEKRPYRTETFGLGKESGIIFIADTLLLLGLPNSDTSFYSVYGLRSNKYLGRVIRKGKPFEELSSVLFNGQVEKDDTGIKIWITDFVTMEMNLINLTHSLERRKTIVDKRISIAHREIPEAVSLFYINNKQIVGHHNVVRKDEPLNNRFFILNSSTAKVENKPVPDIKTEVETNLMLRNMMYTAMTKLKPDASMVIEMRSYQPMINIFTSSGELVNSLIFEKEYPASFDNETISNRKYRYYNSWLDVSDKFIYILRRDQQAQNKSSIISVLDLKGNFVENRLIPAKIVSFAIDDKNKAIYGFNVQEKRVFKYLF